jgi:hypothetical protein
LYSLSPVVVNAVDPFDDVTIRDGISKISIPVVDPVSPVAGSMVIIFTITIYYISSLLLLLSSLLYFIYTVFNS